MKFISCLALFGALFALASAQEGFQSWFETAESTQGSSNQREFWASYYDFAASNTGDKKLLLKDVDPKMTNNLVVVYQDMKLSDDFVISFSSTKKRSDFISGVKKLKSHNRHLRVYFDIYLRFGSKLVNRIRDGGYSFADVAKKFTKFVSDLRVVDGFVMRNEFNLYVEPQVTDEFYKELSASLNKKNIKLIGFIPPFDDALRPAFQHLYRVFIMDRSINVLRDNKLSHPTALFRRTDDTYFESSLNKDFEIDYMIWQGAPRDKVILLVGGGGYRFHKADARLNEIGSPRKELDEYGDLFIPLPEVCEYLKQHSWYYRFDNVQKVPIAYNETLWLAYDNLESVGHKIEMIKSKQIRGAFLDSLDFDDFNGKSCGSGKYPIANLLRKNL